MKERQAAGLLERLPERPNARGFETGLGCFEARTFRALLSTAGFEAGRFKTTDGARVCGGFGCFEPGTFLTFFGTTGFEAGRFKTLVTFFRLLTTDSTLFTTRREAGRLATMATALQKLRPE